MLEQEFVLLILRLVIGLLFVGHGLQKLFGWFGGSGLEGTAGFFESLDVHPPQAWAVIASLAETLGGLGLALGFLTPIAAGAIIGVMLMAIIKVHFSNTLLPAPRPFPLKKYNQECPRHEKPPLP